MPLSTLLYGLAALFLAASADSPRIQKTSQ